MNIKEKNDSVEIKTETIWLIASILKDLDCTVRIQ